jgi:hypothetical protein
VALPWHRSGRVVRSGIALARTAEDLGLVDTTPRQVLRVAVAGLPLLAALVFGVAVLGRMRLVGAGAIVIGVAALSCALLLYRIDGGRQLGPRATVVTAVAATGAGLVLVGRRGDRR